MLRRARCAILVAFACVLLLPERSSAQGHHSPAATDDPGSPDRLSSSSAAIDERLRQSVPLYGVLAQAVIGESSASAVCRSQAIALLRAIDERQMWALKAIDASGAVRNAFVWGEKAWLGSETHCDYLNEAPPFSLSTDVPKTMHPELIITTSAIPMTYRMVFSNFSTPYQIDSLIYLTLVNRLGLCVPEACSNEDVGNMVQSYWDGKHLLFQQLYSIEAQVLHVRSTNVENFLALPQVKWLGSIVFVFIVLLVALGLIPVSNSAFFGCFSLRENVVGLFAPVPTRSDAIGAIRGIRVIICSWIMINHCVFFSMLTYGNIPELMRSLDGFAVQAIFIVVLYVDVFFVLSGILLAYNFLGNAEKLRAIRDGSLADAGRSFVRHVLHRYLRLTPMLLVSMALGHLLAVYLQQSSEYYVDSRFDLFCSSSAWSHALLYVQNLYSVSDMCATWTWYVACDLQFYAIMLLLLYAYAKWPRYALGVFAGLVSASLVAAFAILLAHNVTPCIDSILANIDHLYVTPWMRFQPYAAGVVCGAVLVRLRSARADVAKTGSVRRTDAAAGPASPAFTPSPNTVRLYWLSVWIAIVVSVFIMYVKVVPAWLFAAGFSVGRLLLAVTWGSAIVACSLGLGGRLNELLSGRVFAHFDRLSYASYMVNPLLVVALNASQGSDRFEVVPIIAKITGLTALTYVVALFAAPIIEIPFQRLSQLYVMGRRPTIAK